MAKREKKNRQTQHMKVKIEEHKHYKDTMVLWKDKQYLLH